MKARERRKAILDMLRISDVAINGTALSEKLGVSRQIIVSDISALKAEGFEISSTHHGYYIENKSCCEAVFKVKHTKDQTEDELNTVISLGGTVENVYVWHKVYGKIEAPLGIADREQIEKFMEGVRSGKSTELMNITGGYHYHLIRAASEKELCAIRSALEEKGYIVPEKN